MLTFRSIPSSLRLLVGLAALCLAKTPADAEAAREPGPDDPPFWRVIKEPLPFEPRIFHGTVVHNDRLWVIGGNAKEGWLNDVWSSPDGVEWTEVTAAAPWTPRSQHQCVVYDGRIWVIGGYDGALLNDVWSSTDGKDWQPVTDHAPWSPRTDFRAEVFDGRLIVLGGQEDWRRLSDVWASTDGRDWQCLTPAAPWPGRSRFASVVHDGRLFVGMGSTFSYDKWITKNKKGYYEYLGDLWVSDNGADWTKLQDKGPYGARVDAAMVSLGDYIFLMRSGDNFLSQHVSRSLWFSRDGLDWNPLQRPSQGWRDEDIRVYYQPVAFHDKVWMIGGGAQAFAYLTFFNNIRALEGAARPLDEQISSRRD